MHNVKTSRVTRSRLRDYNRKRVLRTIYMQLADNRAALAEETGLAKPTISDLVAELIADGLLIEEGLGESTESGGKRPRLLRFLPDSRQVIGVALHQLCIHGMVTNLDGQISVEHRADLISTDQDDVFALLTEVINALIAQLRAPLLCISVGVSGVVDDEAGVVRVMSRFEWHNVPLASLLEAHYEVPVYVSNSPELAALAQFAFNQLPDVRSLATIMIGSSIGFGRISRALSGSTGSDIGHLLLQPQPALTGETVEALLGWGSVQQRARALGRLCASDLLDRDDLSYWHIRYAAAIGDEAALRLEDELSATIAQIFAWVIALLRPEHVSLAGAISALGDSFLMQVVDKTRHLLLPDLVDAMTFSVNETENLIGLGAAAKAVEIELGIV
jgi:predicted NBD/HSP70 family sugar kinase